MKLLLDFMADAVKAFIQEEPVFAKPWQRKRTPRSDLGTLNLAPKSPQFPHHQYVDVVPPHQKALDFERSLKRPMPLPSSSETAPKKRKTEFDLDEDELEQRRSGGIVIRDRESSELPEKRMRKKKEKYSDFSDEEKKAKKKKKNVRDFQAALALPEKPELPEKLRAKMRDIAKEYDDQNFDDKSAICVIQKMLSASDISRQQNRLTIPSRQAREKFLTDEEEAFLSEKIDKHTNHIEVPIVEPTGGTLNLTLRKWNVGKKSVSYVLNGEWMDVVSLNDLREGQVVQVWAFRILGMRLHLAFVFSEKPKVQPKLEQGEASTSQETLAPEEEPQAAPLLLTQGETATTTEDEAEVGTAGSSGSTEGSNVRNCRIFGFDLNMDAPDES